MDVVHVETTALQLRLSFCVLELHKEFDWRATAHHTWQSFSDTTLCTYCKHVHMSLFDDSMTTKFM